MTNRLLRFFSGLSRRENPSFSKPPRYIPVLLLVSILFSGILVSVTALPASAGSGNPAYNWYCVHEKNHIQPKADPQFSFIGSLGGLYADPHHSDPHAADKVIYLTFDAGYENGNVGKILDVLKEEQVCGAFFILGNLAVKHPELVRRMADEGHLVCNHTYGHPDMSGKSREEFRSELERMEEACLRNTGVRMQKFFRPPEGKFSRDTLRFAQEMGYTTVFWSFGYADWDNIKQPPHDVARRKILENAHNGEIMLLHPTSATNAAVLGEVIRVLKADGYRFGSLTELTGQGNTQKE